jgi:hypothetical protein
MEEKSDEGPRVGKTVSLYDGGGGGAQRESTLDVPMALSLAPPEDVGGVGAKVVPASVAATRALFGTIGAGGATDRQIKAALLSAAAQVLGGALVLDKATVIAEGGAKRVQLMEMGREWPNSEFGGLLSAMADAE